MKKSEKKCATPYCCNDKRTGHGFCHKCVARRFRATHPETYSYNTLKQNAKRRGHAFVLTLDEFIKFCGETNYLALKGKTKNSASIDRKIPHLGYVYGNLQILSLSENTKKRYADELEEKCPF